MLWAYLAPLLRGALQLIPPVVVFSTGIGRNSDCYHDYLALTTALNVTMLKLSDQS